MANKYRNLFDSLYREYQPMVWQMCRGFVRGDREQSQDLTQEVFINIWNALDKFRGASGYKTWIYRITVNTCLKYIRDRKDHSRVGMEAVVHRVADTAPTQTDATQHALYQAIGQLGEVDRLIMMLVLDELDYAEISDIIGISEGNLRVKIHRIKKNLKKILEHA